jgi:hypothetical protein
MKAICIRCGASKQAPWLKCLECGLTPEGEDLVKSTYCSVWRFTDDAELESQYEAELRDMSVALRGQQQLVYDEIELDRVRELVSFVEKGSPGVWIWLIRMFLPAIILLSFLYLLLYLLGT